ncbi:hypothetical protein GH714_044018 [Hevea brasiliensis]|uniref:Uncharacterized protein n=1 Tax=Hevea brasiliensis TaxID=3981 RepID=A0A6A6K217_HEVBR|nr:hypothetical protein GH714_044018 [Hevea brasiliensis]
MPLIMALPDRTRPSSSYPEGNFGGNQLLDGSISLSPYTQVRRTICTSVSLRASTRVSSGFAPLRHSSPSFGSRQACSHEPSQKIEGRSAVQTLGGIPPVSFLAPYGFTRPLTRTHVRLLVFSLGRNLRPIGAAFPNNPTRRQRLVVRQGPARRGSHPLRRPFQGTWARSAAEDASPDYNSDAEGARFSSWALPVRSPYRGILVSSFPPLIDMLKLSGCSA